MSCFVNTTSRVWVSQTKDVWEPAEVLNRTETHAELLISRPAPHGTEAAAGAGGSGSTVRAMLELSQVSIVPRNPAHLEGTDDMIALQFLDEPNIMHNLEERCAKIVFPDSNSRVR